MRIRNLTWALGLLCALAALAPAAALAAPQLGVTIVRGPDVVPSNYEAMNYRVTVGNEASASASPGAEITCARNDWIEGSFTSNYRFQWVRDGVRLESSEDIAHGSQTDAYTVQATDEGHALQCLVTGENPDVENEVDHTTGHPVGSAYYSQPPRVIDPAPAGLIPTPSSVQSATRPALAGPFGSGTDIPGEFLAGNELRCTAPSATWNTIGTATTTAGSNELTNVVTGETRVDVEVGSPIVTRSAAFAVTGRLIPGQAVTIGNAAVIDPGATIVAVDGDKITLSHPVTASGASKTNKAFLAGSQPLKVGDDIAGAGIPTGTTITKVAGRTVTMSAPATASATAVKLKDEAADVGVWSFEWLLNGEPIGGGPGEGEVTATTQTTSRYKLAASELQQPGAFQCVARAETAAGAASVASTMLRTDFPAPSVSFEQFPWQGPGVAPIVEAGSASSGAVALDVELPGGQRTRISSFSAPGWTCVAQEPSGPLHAGLSCSRSDALEPEASYPEIAIQTEFGPDLEVPAVATAEISGGGSDPDTAEDVLVPAPPVEFGIKSLAAGAFDESGADFTQAGGHPQSARVDLELPTRITRDGKRAQIEFLKDIRTDTPPGFVGNPQAAPQECDSTQKVLSDTYEAPTCPRESIVGSVDVDTRATGALQGLALYSLEPEPGAPAQLTFTIKGVPVIYSLIPRLRPEDGYAISVDAPSTSKNPVIYSISVKLCGYGVEVGPTGDSSQYRSQPQVTACKKPGDTGANPVPFVTNPTECTGNPAVTKVSVASWENPGVFKSKEATSPAVTGCENVPFEPEVSLRATADSADSPTGLDVAIDIPTEGLETAGENAQSALKDTVVTLPEGMAVNPASAAGLGACSPGEIRLGTNDPVACPDASKLGTAEVVTPLLDEPLEGVVYLAQPHDNPSGSLLALYLVVESEERGILVKLPGEVETDPNSGRLTASFKQNPQLPLAHVEVSFPPGPRASLITPPTCGSHEARATLTPWSGGAAVTDASSLTVRRGPTGGACAPSEAALPNAPVFQAGSESPIAGAFSPLVIKLSRQDGSQRFGALDISPPPGLLAKLAGTATCSDASLAAAAARTGREEQGSASCPPASQLGTVFAAAGAGPAPFWVTGKAYLAGPYKGAPLSIAVVTPAVAGPFDLGNVVIRTAVRIDPVTSRITAVTDPIPHILEGIPLDIREVSIRIDRPQFALNPTSCAPMSFGGSLQSTLGATVPLDSRFQVGQCGRLPFKPKLDLFLKGATRRTKLPKLIATVKARPGDANLAALSVRLPRSAFLEQAHIGTVCTRVQWAADACPARSVYGRISVKTPLLDETLAGNVYLRSSNNPLPDLVADIRGPAYRPIRLELAGKTDTVKQALRNTFSFVPDAPFTEARLVLFGGKRGLIVNSRNICKRKERASVTMDGQNGAIHDFRPVVRNSCGKKKKKRARAAHRRSPGR